MIKKLKKDGTISLLIAMTLLLVFAFRLDWHQPGTDQINLILFYLTLPFAAVGSILQIKRAVKIRKEINKKARESENYFGCYN